MMHPHTFFVTWRSPETRAIVPFARIQYDPASNVYEFAYIGKVDAARRAGFVPLIEFPDLRRVYRSREIFPLLANRLMPKKRPEYPQLLQSLGLSEQDDPMDILARTGGQRQTDQIELFPVPAPDADGCYLTYCLARGVRHMPAPETEERIARLKSGERLEVAPEDDNPHDPQAVLLRTQDGVAVGYLPAYLAADIRYLREKCGTVEVEVVRVNPPPAEAHHRLLIRVRACWPDGFRPYSHPDFQPLAASPVSVG